MADPEDDQEDGDEQQPTEVKPAANAGDERGVKKQKREQATREQESKAFWVGAFSTVVGRREMWGILAQLHPFETIYAVGPNGFPQPEATFAHMGVQQVGLGLFLKWQQENPDAVKLMLEENDPRFIKAKPARALLSDAETLP